MILKSIHLNHFRNFADQTFNFHPVLTIILGENARGKTNILEGIHVSVTGWGFRESKEEELLQWNAKQAGVESVWEENNDTSSYIVTFLKRNTAIEKHFFVNKARKTHVAYSQHQTNVVLFAPEQIEIITGSPERRRDYFNKLIFNFDLEYKKRLHNYEHALYKRNKVLEFQKDTALLREELSFWNEYLETQASYLTAKRQSYVNYLNNHREVENKIFHVEYIKNELTKKKLEDVFEQEQRLRKTLVGPQKDEFQLYLKNGEEKNIHHFGSRSEQRLGIFWLKLNELQYFEEFRKDKPILLLDDIFSELDVKNSQLILDMMGSYQTILTATEKKHLDLAHIEKSIINL